MKFRSKGKLGIDIDVDSFHVAKAEVEKSIRELMANRDYGQAISLYDIAINIFSPSKEEKFLFNLSTNTTEIDVNIDQTLFLAADARRRCLLYLLAVIYSVDRMKNNEHLTGFNFDLFRADLVVLIGRYQSFGGG